jgi:lysophospholipase L1-like esterase
VDYSRAFTMKLLIISDSHGKQMGEVIEEKREGWEVRTLRVGRKLDVVLRLYRNKLRGIRGFRPDAVVMHLGHNDLVKHPIHNLDPDFITMILDKVYRFANEVARNFPASRIIVSSLFPRVESARYGEVLVGRYNKMARRFGERLRSRGNQTISSFGVIINRRLWGRIARWEVRPGNHKDDGLHMNAVGRGVVADGWIEALEADQ